jgi:hypothetical protein
MDQTVKSLLNHNIKRNAGHHHMFVITSTHTSETVIKTINTPLFVKIWNVPKTTHEIVKKKLELIDIVLQY